MDYSAVFSKSFKQWWQNKYLWLIGILGVVLSGTFSVDYFNNDAGKATDYFNMQAFEGMSLILALALGLFMLIFSLLGLYLRLRAESSLIQATSEIGSGHKLSFSSAWGKGSKGIWTLLGLNILLGLPLILLALMIFALTIFVALSAETNETGALVLIFALVLTLLCCVIFVYILVSSALSTVASRVAILKGEGVLSSLKQAWEIIKDNLTHLLVFLLLGTVIPFLQWILSFPFFLLSAVASVSIVTMLGTQPYTSMLAGLVAGAFLGVLTSLVMGPLASLSSMYWTNVYLSLEKK